MRQPLPKSVQLIKLKKVLCLKGKISNSLTVCQSIKVSREARIPGTAI